MSDDCSLCSEVGGKCDTHSLFEVTAALRAELTASESLVTALQEQMSRLAEQHAKAVAEAREEMKEAMIHAYLTAPSTMGVKPSQATMVKWLRATPLDSTPLAARIAEVEDDFRRSVELLEGERDAVRDRVVELESALAAKSVVESERTANQTLEALGWLAFEAESAGLDLSESDNPRWREDIRELLAAPRELRVMPCGHHISNRNRSVETGVYFCDACRNAEMLRDALAAESSLRSKRNSLKSALAAEVERHQATAKDLEEQRDYSRRLETKIPGPDCIVVLKSDYERLIASLPAGPRVVR